MDQKELKFVPLGGIAEVNKNMFIYETAKDILVVDCGAGFPEEETEERLLIPDFSYLHSTQKKIQGVVVSHAHFDHYGALPYFLAKFDVPVFSSRLGLAFIREKLQERGMDKKKNFHLLKKRKKLTLGDFSLTPFLVNHSVPDALGLSLTTPAGRIFHLADYKFDLTPVNGQVFDFQSCLKLAERGVLALFSDCLGASETGFTQTEKAIGQVLLRLMEEAEGQLFVTTLSSNLSRIQQIINAAQRLNRKIVVLGRSMETSIKIAQKLGYLKTRRGEIKTLNQKGKLSEKKIVYLVAGSYGQSNSTLVRIARGDHSRIRLKKGAMVVFSADPSPPGTREKVDKLVDLLTRQGARVHYYEIQENLHVSGHGSSEDIKLLIALVKPRFLVPIGGPPRYMRAYTFLAEQMEKKRKRVFELFNGQPLIFQKGKARLGKKIRLEKRFV